MFQASANDGEHDGMRISAFDSSSDYRLFDVYNRYFDVVQAANQHLLEEAYRLRYQVYCVENEFENAADNPGGLEIDEYDTHSAHSLLVHRPSEDIVGTVRLVLPVRGALDRCFPIQKVCQDPMLGDPDLFPAATTAEVSRFCISKGFRRRRGEHRYPNVSSEEERNRLYMEERRLMPYITLALIKGLVQMSATRGITHWCIVVEPPLLRFLRSLGLFFQPVGPLVNYHGLRQPSHADLDALLAGVWSHRPDVWEVITNRGKLWPLTDVRRPRIEGDRTVRADRASAAGLG